MSGIAIVDDRECPLLATAVVVLYLMDPNRSPAFRSLMEARMRLDSTLGRLSIVLWDNGPSRYNGTLLAQDVTYIHDARNPGLVAAYNKALKVATDNGSKWLITLDQDTIVPPEYLMQMANAARLCSSRAGVGAIVPQIASGAKQLSPNIFVFGAVPRWFAPGFRGIPEQPVFAFNSGAMVRIDVLDQIGGYDTRFPLDHSDSALFCRLCQYGKRIYVDGGVQLRHEFSMMDMKHRMRPERYRNVLMTESAFWDLHMNWIGGCERTLRLLLRMVKHWIRKDGTELRQITWQGLKARLLYTRAQRIKKWAQATNVRTGRVVDAPAAGRRKARVSVCMAAYNGSKCIREQLESILPQLSADDELVVVDDASNDETVERIREIGDKRIRLFEHGKNEGVVATFEDTLREATGEILFLCDDDDVWAPTKVERMLGAFREWPEAQVVISKAILIDERGVQQPDSRMNRFGRFKPGFWRNVFKNHYQGSAMAIRASLLGQVLPFPRNKSFLHDVWIGTRNEAAGGKTVFIDEPLVYYRRHSQNVSRAHPWRVKIRLRMELLMANVASALRFKTSMPVVMESGEMRR